MGCDIHFHQEVKINDKWEHYSQREIRRNYSLFAKMAGVRNYDEVNPISAPKGLPEDASFLTKFMSDLDGLDGHSHSWLDANEIVELEEWLIKELGSESWKLESTYWGYFFGNSWAAFVKYPEETPTGVQDIRFVFWFDN